MTKRTKFKFISFLLIACLCLNIYQPAIYANDADEGSVNRLSMKFALDGFSTYEKNNYAFEFNEDTGYTSAGDIWVDCIKKGFKFSLDKPLNLISLMYIKSGSLGASAGSFTIGNKAIPMTLNYKGGTGDADWVFEEVKPDINYYERFINTDAQGHVTTVLINDVDANYSHGTNFKQVFVKGMQAQGGAGVESELKSKNDNVEIYKLTAKIDGKTYNYIARITFDCDHSSVDHYPGDGETHVKDYIVDYLKGKKLDQTAYADYCVDMCSDCGKFMKVHHKNEIDDPPDGPGDEPGTDEPGGGGKEEGNDPPAQSEDGQVSANTVPAPAEKQKDGTVVDAGKGKDSQDVSPAGKPYIKFLKKTYKVKKGKAVKIRFKSSGIDCKKLKVKASKKGCVSIKKVTKSYILIKAKKKGKLTITLKDRSLKAKVGLKIK